jgi:hypothetical protein
MRARIFRRAPDQTYTYGGEVDATGPDDAWKQLQPRQSMREGDVIYVGDIYYELISDGGWKVMPPGELTRELYALGLDQNPAY